eukprot:1566507-Amphidinium_carterae.1
MRMWSTAWQTQQQQMPSSKRKLGCRVDTIDALSTTASRSSTTGHRTSPPSTSAVCSTSRASGGQRYHHRFCHHHQVGLQAMCLTTV